MGLLQQYVLIILIEAIETIVPEGRKMLANPYAIIKPSFAIYIGSATFEKPNMNNNTTYAKTITKTRLYNFDPLKLNFIQ